MEAIKDSFTLILYQPLFNALIFLAWLIPGHSIGWAIIVLTILIRLLLLPSNLKMLHQQQRLRALQPKIEELKQKHGTDRTAHSQAIMELYAAEKVNPLGSCLPMLVQLPVLIVLYQVFVQGLSTGQFHLLYSFTPHLPTINTSWYGLDLTKPEPWVLPILAGVLQYFQARQMAPLTSPLAKKEGQPDVSQLMQRQMLYIFPLVTVFITRSVPAALGLYWVVFSLFNLLQQTWALRQLAKVKPGSAGAASEVTVTVRTKSK